MRLLHMTLLTVIAIQDHTIKPVAIMESNTLESLQEHYYCGVKPDMNNSM